MKKFTTLLITSSLLSGIAFARDSQKTVTEIKATVHLNNLNCVTNVSGITITEIGDGYPLIFRETPENTVELNHVTARAEGCNLEKLQALANEAGLHFGFLEDVAVKVTKEMRVTFKTKTGQCRGWFAETLEIDLRDGLVVTSSLLEEREATGCR